MEDVDVLTIAAHLVRRYGENAAIEAALRADHLRDEGAVEERHVWKQVVAAINALETQQPSGTGFY